MRRETRPVPLDAIGIRVVGRRINQKQLIREFGQHPPHEQRPLSRMSLQIVCNHERETPAGFRTCHCGPHLFAKDIGGPPRSKPAIKPAVSPIHQPKAIDLAIIARRFHQALPATPFQAPDPREGRMKGKLYLILQGEIGMRQHGEEVRQVSWELTPQINFDQVSYG